MATYILGYRDFDKLEEFATKREADDVCQEWCAVDAESIEAARARYEDAFAAAQADGFARRSY